MGGEFRANSPLFFNDSKDMKEKNPAALREQDPGFEDLKNWFLAALYEKDAEAAGQIYQEILDKAKSLGTGLRENEEKVLRQIQAAGKRFSKTLPREKRDELRTLLGEITRDQAGMVWTKDYTSWARQLNLLSWQEQRLFETAITFQLSKGCSHFCRRCNEWALPKVRGHFSRTAVLQILEKLQFHGNRDLALYGASDPLDWEDPPHGFDDILSGKTIRYSVLTKVPRGKTGQLRSLIQKEIPFSVSLTDRNRKRIKSLEQAMDVDLPKQHDLNELLIPAGLDEDFSTVKPSITDAYGSEITPEGAFIIIPTFTSALYPMGHAKIPISRETRFFPVKLLGRPALLKDYFKPLEVWGKNPEPFFIDYLLPVQVASILLDSGDYDLTPPGMRSIKEYFEVFDERARTKRKKNTLSVMRKLKTEFLGNRTYSELAFARKKEYRSRIRAHINFTREKPVLRSRISATAFFLAAIKTYLPAHPLESRIIAHLTREEFQGLQQPAAAQRSLVPLIELFSDNTQDAWQIFRFYALSLVHGQDTAHADRFLAQWPSQYDPGQDRFVPAVHRP